MNNPNPLHYVRSGRGRPVILLHGMAASLHDWDSLLPALAGAGYSAYAVDLLGHGESLKPSDPSHYHASSMAAQLTDWLDTLGLVEPPVLVGHSLGGHLAMSYALQNPDRVSGLVLVDPFYSRHQLPRFVRMLKWVPSSLGARMFRYLPQWVVRVGMRFQPDGADFSQQARLQIERDYQRAAPEIMYIPHTVQDLTDSAGEIKVPALVAWGEKDRTLDPRSFSLLVQLLPKARGHSFPATGHQPHIAKQSEFNLLVLDFLGSGQQV